MRIRILFILIFITPVFIQAQSFSEGFEDVSSIFGDGWVQVNNSSPEGPQSWRQDIGNFTAHSGPANSSIISDYTNIAPNASGDISGWLITPTIMLTEGDSIIFWTKSFQNAAFPDRMEVRLNRLNTTNAGNSTTSVGDFDSLLLVINPNLSISINPYPMEWTRYAIKIAGVSPFTPCRIGFRYFIPNGGENGDNGSTIGIDDFEYKTIFTGVEEQEPLVAYIQLLNNQLLVEVPEAENPFSVEVMDVSGKMILMGEYNKSASIDPGFIHQGVYLVRITYQGKYLIKKIFF